MKRSATDFLIPVLLIGLFSTAACAAEAIQSPSPAQAVKAAVAPAPPAASRGKEYYDAIVLLIDHDKGLLGVVVPNELTGRPQKRSFRVDVKGVVVTNHLNRMFLFSDVQAGDRVDIYTRLSPAGHEIVSDIIDYSRSEKEA